MTPKQSRAARALLGWTQPDLARAAGVATSMVNAFERNGRRPIPNNLRALRRALEEAGIALADDGSDGVSRRLVQAPEPAMQARP